MTYEVFYQHGGHSGPYEYDAARDMIGRLLLKDTYAALAARSAEGVGGYLPVTLFQKVDSGTVFALGWETLVPSRIPTAFKHLQVKA